MSRKRLLTGDTPTGQLHIGHYVGSIENRLKLQNDYECYFLIANTHAFSTHAEHPDRIRHSVFDITLDYLSCGLDPTMSTIFCESDVPAIFELATWFSMLTPFPRLMRNPTIKDEIRDKKLGDNYSMGFLWYPLLQVADILAFRAEIVPVGEDQLPHLEMTREVARRFNQLYCGVDSHTKDADYVAAGGLFPIPEATVGRIKRLVGLGGPSPHGQLLKMSKSYHNSILLSDDADTIRKKVMGMYTDPKRLRASDPGTIENNPLWIFHDTFNTDKEWLKENKLRYQQGAVGDVECKKKLAEILIDLIEPISLKRRQLSQDPDFILTILRTGADKANIAANKTLRLMKEVMQQCY